MNGIQNCIRDWSFFMPSCGLKFARLIAINAIDPCGQDGDAITFIKATLAAGSKANEDLNGTCYDSVSGSA